jgi:hypothetical protein
LTTSSWDGKRNLSYHYRYVNQVPIRAKEPAMDVNWCEVTVTDTSNGEKLYDNAFATCHEIHDENVAEIVRAGRARWKVENEGNNVLKNNGYHLEHNFGHGKEHLAGLLLGLNLLAFLFHTALELIDNTYQKVRHLLGTRRGLFDNLRILARYIYFESWQALFEFILWSGSPPDCANSS